MNLASTSATIAVPDKLEADKRGIASGCGPIGASDTLLRPEWEQSVAEAGRVFSEKEIKKFVDMLQRQINLNVN
jgi:hypothetical protein